MTSLRKIILLTLILLIIVFNIERLDFGKENLIDIDDFVYLVVAIAALSILTIPILRRLSTYLLTFLWVGVYIMIKLAFFGYRSFIGGLDTYLTVTGIAFVAAAVVLIKEMVKSLDSYERMIEQITFPGIERRVSKLEEANDSIKTEFIRSRRHDRPLSVLILQLDGQVSNLELRNTVNEIQRAMMNRFAMASLAKVLSKEARRTDMILEQEENDRFILVCPETQLDGSIKLAERVQVMIKERLGVSVAFGSASFPNEALTFDELLHKAETNLKQSNKVELPMYEVVK
ncbi:MAG: GGDEF domain-containing protein [Omnitrophica WOR_2 bacterium]